MKKVEVIIENLGVGGIVLDSKKGIVEFNSKKEFIKKSLYLEFESEEEILKYWNDWYGDIESVKEVVDMILEEEECLGEDWDGKYSIKEDVFVSIVS